MRRNKTSRLGILGSLTALAALAAGAGYAQRREVPSVAEAARLEQKIRAIEAANEPGRTGRNTVDVSELELESYVLYGIEPEIAVRVDSVDLEIRSGELSATADETLVQLRQVVADLSARGDPE